MKIDLTIILWVILPLLLASVSELELSISPINIRIHRPYILLFLLFVALSLWAYEQDVRQKVKKEQVELKEKSDEKNHV